MAVCSSGCHTLYGPMYSAKKSHYIPPVEKKEDDSKLLPPDKPEGTVFPNPVQPVDAAGEQLQPGAPPSALPPPAADPFAPPATPPAAPPP